MPSYIMYVEVCSDGIGDYFHFEDILNNLLVDPNYADVAFIPIVYSSHDKASSAYNTIHKRLLSLGIPFYFGDSDEMEQFIATEKLQKELAAADQLISISFTRRLPPNYSQYISKAIPHKFIHEHDRGGYYPDEETTYRPMGLSEKHYGIKLKPCPPVSSPQLTWEIIEQNDASFAKKLIECTGVLDFETFYDKYALMPVYFNANDELFRMILPIIGVNNTYPDNNKSLVICHSGANLIDFLNGPNNRMHYGNADIRALISPKEATRNTTTMQMISMILENTQISRLEVYQPDEEEPLIIQGCLQGAKVIKILSGFYLSTPSFDALYQLSKVAGVSGDTTLERCISMDILPFYRSFNYKWETLTALNQMIQTSVLDISEEAKTSFHLLFSKGIAKLISEGKVSPQAINFPAMLKAWPTVTAYLRKHCNFYNNLNDIMLEDLPYEAMPKAFQTRQHSL